MVTWNPSGGYELRSQMHLVTNIGTFHAALNWAKLWNLPIIFMVENNQYAMGTSVNRSSAEDQLYRRGESFRIPGLQVDGMDVRAVKAAADKAIRAPTMAGKRPGPGSAALSPMPLGKRQASQT